MKMSLWLPFLLLGAIGAGCSGSSTTAKSDLGPRGDGSNPFPSYDLNIIGWTEAGQPIIASDGGGTSGTLKLGPYVKVTAGSFMMGSPETEPCRSATKEDHHKVTLTHGFEIGQHETTQDEFESLMGYNPSKATDCGATCPAENMSWFEAAAYCNAVSLKKGLTPCYSCTGSGADVQCEVDPAFASGTSFYECPGYRLPTEAEWEYAYRAGTTDAFYNGAIDAAMCSGLDPNADAIGWFIKNAQSSKHPGEGKLANAWGLYDMAGNVAEWVNDGYQAALGRDDATDPTGPPALASTPIRGGHYASSASNIRGAYRQSQTRKNPGTGIGFRCVVTNAIE